MECPGVQGCGMQEIFLKVPSDITNQGNVY